MTEFTHLAKEGTEVAIRVTPKAARNEVFTRDGEIRVNITTVPEDGKANQAARKLLAKAIGVAPTRLVLVRGATARNKVFKVV